MKNNNLYIGGYGQFLASFETEIIRLNDAGSRYPENKMSSQQTDVPQEPEVLNFQKSTTYIGTKIVVAKKMTRNAYDKMKNPNLAEELAEDQRGYVIQYEDNYVSWSPADVFERCYREITESEKRLM